MNTRPTALRNPLDGTLWVCSTSARFCILLLLCSAYLLGGLTKLLDFSGAQLEMAHFGLQPPALFAATSIATELVASILVLSGRFRWFGALWLAVFTAVATMVANRFWELPTGARMQVANGFFEHLGLIGGFLFVAVDDIRHRASLR